MFDMSKPVGVDLIIYSIIFIVALIGIGLGVVAYYKNRVSKEQK